MTERFVCAGNNEISKLYVAGVEIGTVFGVHRFLSFEFI